MPVLMAAWLPLMRGVQEAGVAATSAPPGKTQFRQRLQAAVVDGARAIGKPLAAFDMLADGRMRLLALEFLERAQIRVGVVEADDEANRDQVVLQVIEEAAAIGVVLHRPADGVHDEAGLGLRPEPPTVP